MCFYPKQRSRIANKTLEDLVHWICPGVKATVVSDSGGCISNILSSIFFQEFKQAHEDEV